MARSWHCSPDTLATAYLCAETTFNPGAGLVFDESTLYAGLVGDMTLAAALAAYTSSSGDPTITVTNPGTLTYGKVSVRRSHPWAGTRENSSDGRL